jgi:hypothetical protein
MRSQNNRNQGGLMIEGSGSGSVPLTNGSGSRRPKNIGSYGSGSPTLLPVEPLLGSIFSPVYFNTKRSTRTMGGGYKGEKAYPT